MHVEKRISRKEVYQGRIFTVYQDQVQLENGEITQRDHIEHGGAVAVVAFAPNGNLLMVRQYRSGSSSETLEIPAGKLDLGENPERCAARELEEETGYRAGKLTLLTQMLPSPAYCSEKIWIYLAEELQPGSQHLDATEFLSVEEVPYEKALELCLSGKGTAANTQVALLAYDLQTRRGIE